MSEYLTRHEPPTKTKDSETTIRTVEGFGHPIIHCTGAWSIELGRSSLVDDIPIIPSSVPVPFHVFFFSSYLFLNKM
jgi:hypothetical protein